MKLIDHLKVVRQVAWEGKCYDDFMWKNGYGEPIYDEEGNQIGEEEPRRPRPYIFYFLGAIFPTSIAPLICKWKGHDLVDRSYGGPESGCMDHECSRCGQYWSVPLY